MDRTADVVGREEISSGQLTDQLFDRRQNHFGQTLQNAPLTATGGGGPTGGDLDGDTGPISTDSADINGLEREEMEL